MAVHPRPPAHTSLSAAVPLPLAPGRGGQIQPTPRPLLIRPLAEYDCFGDGLCCTDIHALGPVTRVERRAVELLEPGALVRHKDLGEPVFRTQSHGPCVLRSARGCELHARHGAQAKPIGCSRFPFGLVATPDGGRVTTEHRCPCRTLGARPALTVPSAEPWLRDTAGRLSPNGRVGPRMRLASGKSVSFARFRAIEQPLLDALLAGADPYQVLETKPFGRLDGMSFRGIAEEMRKERDGSAYGEAMVWFGSAVASLLGGKPLALGPRPWSESFDRAEARSPEPRKAKAVLHDWLADLLWSLDWVFQSGTFEAGKRELATLYAVADAIARRLVRARVRPDRAAAEAVMIAEIARQSDAWERVQSAL
ncbi:MAG TPA: hypothetical protein VFZ61_09500 [Polyangiales bacterium]